MDCGVYATATGGELSYYRMAAGGGDDGVYSHESEHDLAVMVSDFLENGSGDSHRYNSSDSDSSFSDLPSLADNIKVFFLLVFLYFLTRNFISINE